MPDIIGYPNRDENFDVLPGFINPPQGYGQVPFYWWLGDPLTKERIEWQLDRLKDKSITGLQVNYAHSDSGGRTYGLTYPSDPPLFSEDWWDLFCWFLKQAKRRGMSVSLSDYTLGIPGQGWYTDEVLEEHPEICGTILDCEVKELACCEECSWQLPENILSVMAYHVTDGSVIDLRDSIKNNILHWKATEGNWKVVAVFGKAVPVSIDPMDPISGPEIIDKFFQRFEDRNPGEGGEGLNFFFSDELQFGIGGNLWNDRFASEFLKRKGYDIIPELPALFMDIGPKTPKIRLDYSDVVVTLQEEGYFRPVYEWHQERGMLYGCDHGGRGRNVVEFGDYFRTQSWMPGPGNDSPQLSADVIKNKVASSISHLYQRPRTWLEGYHSSGWGTTTAEVTDATFRNFVMGHNLLSLHGLYYSTHGGWWEWAPPCNHFRMPYWEHMGEFLKCSERLSYLLSQGVHCCDVAIMYPVAPMQVGMSGKESVDTAFGLGNYLFKQGIDFDYMDFGSLARAEAEDKALRVSGEAYRVLILPAMRAVRYSTLQKALEFYRAGGIVITLNNLPEASDHIGRDDAELDEIVEEIFGLTAKDAGTEIRSQYNEAGGIGILAQKPEHAVKIINNAFTRDFMCLSDLPEGVSPQALHRKIGNRHVYMIYGAPQNSECFFRSQGKVELWDPWTGQTRCLNPVSQTAEGTTIKMPLGENEAQLIIFNVSESSPSVVDTDLDKKFSAIDLNDEWEFELKPTLDNTWGDYRLPAFDGMIGAEARKFRYAEEISANPNWQDARLDDSEWSEVTCSYSPYFWQLGPLPEDLDLSGIESKISYLMNIDPMAPVEIGGKEYFWQPYEFSMRWGVEGDPGHQGYHGLKGNVADDFIALGKLKFVATDSVYEAEEDGTRYYLWTSMSAKKEEKARIASGGMKPLKIWLNGKSLNADTEEVQLEAGANPLLLCYDQPGRAYFVLESVDAPEQWKQDYPLAMNWYNKPGLLPFDSQPQNAQPVGWYRFTSPPGLQSMIITSQGNIQAWADGVEMNIELQEQRIDGSRVYRAITSQQSPAPVKVALRIDQKRGYYGGAALPEPIKLECGKGAIKTGDWSQIDGLASYSGGVWYRKTIELSQDQIKGRVILDLGNVASSAEIHVNGQLVGIKVAPSWKVDISEFVKLGENYIEILVYNTLANHYLTIPTRYRGSPVSGLLGPVRIEIENI